MAIQMKTRRPLVLLFCLATAPLPGAGILGAQTPGAGMHPLARRYADGERLAMHISATNEHPGRTGRYDADVSGVVTTDSAGRFVERFAWSHVALDGGSPVDIDSVLARQEVSLSPEVTPRPPDLRRMDPRLIAPALDFLTFYVDLWLAMRQGLVRSGDHRYLAMGAKGSWADGRTIVVGEDGIDFDITLVSLDSASGVARLTVRHVPPAGPAITLPAAWMTTPVDQNTSAAADPPRPNNWVQVAKATSDGVVSYTAGVGRETFDVALTVAIADGRLIAATMDNPVDVLERTCGDSALTQCGEATRYRIHRRIELRQRP